MLAFLLTLLSIFPFRVSMAAHDCSADHASTIVVGKSGGQFTTIQAAIHSIPSNNKNWIKIHINPGEYHEQVKIPADKPCIVLEGEGRSVTTITYDAHALTNTSATFTSFADNTIAKGITFKNSYNHKIVMDLLGRTTGKRIVQALSVEIFGDKSAFYECGFLGLQDTIWDAQGRHYFYKCFIEGAMDFIFGDGQSFYEDCWINASAGPYSSELRKAVITAQGRESPKDGGGFVFRGGTISGDMPVYLGRAYRAYSRVILWETTMNANVVPQGWDAWNYARNTEKLGYAEVDCKGPGSDTSKRVPWEKKLSRTQILRFSRSAFIDQDAWLAKVP